MKSAISGRLGVDRRRKMKMMTTSTMMMMMMTLILVAVTRRDRRRWSLWIGGARQTGGGVRVMIPMRSIWLDCFLRALAGGAARRLG
jgi:hypothetical protein